MPSIPKAVVEHNITRESETLTAAEFEQRIKADPHLMNQVSLSSIAERKPIIFQYGYHAEGHERYIRCHFKHAAGYGPQDHVFDRNKETLDQALSNGKKVLLSLNPDLSYRLLDFRDMEAQGCTKQEDWIEEHKGDYISVPVRSVQDALRTINKVRHHPTYKRGMLNEQVFARYHGGVMAYRQFYLGNRDQDLMYTYNDVRLLKSGVALGESRAIGFPRLIRFVPTDTTLREKGSKGLKGASVPDMKHFSRLIFSHEGVETLANPQYRELWEKISGNPEGIYVLASPTVTINPEAGSATSGAGALEWQMMRWVINDIPLQTTEAGKLCVKEHSAPELAVS